MCTTSGVCGAPAPSYLLEAHLEEAFHRTLDGQQLGGEGWVADADGSVLFLVRKPVDKNNNNNNNNNQV